MIATLRAKLRATEPVVWVGVSGLLFLVARLASYLPARRAARIDPLEAPRVE